MDLKNKMLLQRYQDDIVKDLDVVYIIHDLFKEFVITQDEFERIFELQNRSDRTKYLLEKLIQNGDNRAYQVFVESLAKDHNWLWEKFDRELNNEPMLNNSLEDSLSRGDVPRLRQHHVRRDAVEREIVTKLRALPRHDILVLHGMSGSGKTSIAIGVLRDNPQLISDYFNGIVFWLNLGNCKTEDDIVAQQNKLYRKVSSMYLPSSSYMNSSVSMSSIGSTGDVSFSNYNWTYEDLRDKLKSQFFEPTLKDALLVLDEVNDKKCLEAFDIGCKILITTRDMDVVSNFNPRIVKIKNNFEEKESLELFASCLEVDVSELPRQAKKLHEICKGSPFHIGLIGAHLAENKQRFNDDNKPWNDYLKKLEKKEYFFLPRYHENPMKTIEVSVNSLPPAILPLFKMMSVLPDSVKVSAKVLSKLWNKEVSEVESIMKQLRGKSLIIEYYDPDQKNYMYEIHDLIMTYLRSCNTEEEVKKLHSDLLKNYHYGNDNHISPNIIDDGYIAFFIGYHIYSTKNLNNRYSLFKKLYLDLKFLGNKVRLTGPADVISDLQKYEKNIASDELDKDLLHSIYAYLRTYGIDLYRYPCTDIIQSILLNESKGILYTKASQIAQENSAKNELYFDFVHEQNVEEIRHTTIDVKESITSVSFLGDYAVIGTNTGAIKFFHIITNKLKKELPNAGSRVKWIGVCPVNVLRIASLYDDGVIKLWYIDDLHHDESGDIPEEDLFPDESSNNNYPSNYTISPKLGPFITCRWANIEEVLITHTSKLIVLYDSDGTVRKVIDNFDMDCKIRCCVPCNNDRHVIVATSNAAQSVVVIDMTTKEKVMSFEETDFVLDILTVPGSNRIITLKEREIVEHELKLNTYKNRCKNCKCKKVISSDDVKDRLRFVSMVVNKTGTLLFVSTDDSRVICVDLKTNSYVFDLENRRGNVVSMSMSEQLVDDFMPGLDVLLTGSDTMENSAKVWYLDPTFVSQNTNKNGKVRLTTEFDASFLHTLSPQTPTSTPNSGSQSSVSTPRRNHSFAVQRPVAKPLTKTSSLDRHSLKPLNLKGIANTTDECVQPLLAIIDDKNNIQIMRGRKVLTEIPADSEEQVNIVRISPCNHYILYGLRSGLVKKYTLRTKEVKVIMDVYSQVQYLKFVCPNVLLVAGRNRCLMAYRITEDGTWKPEMLQSGNIHLGSQEILNDIQGIKKKNGHSDRLSDSGSETSLNSNNKGRLCKGSGLVDCFWIPCVGLITVECNATIKLWNQQLKLDTVLHGRQSDVYINCAVFQKNRLAICDDYKRFQTFDLKIGDKLELHTIQEYRLNNRIISCDLSADGNILAMGLDSGDVVLWNIPGKRQLTLLKHHKTKVHLCSFSPVPDRLSKSTTATSPYTMAPVVESNEEEQPPLVLITMAMEIVWWNVTHLIKLRANKTWRTGRNVLTPITSPMESRTDITASIDNLNINACNNFFFNNQLPDAHDSWKSIWRGKRSKEGSKRTEMLACVKLSGMDAKILCHDEKFSSFVTVDNSGHIHIMNVMRPNT